MRVQGDCSGWSSCSADVRFPARFRDGQACRVSAPWFLNTGRRPRPEIFFLHIFVLFEDGRGVEEKVENFTRAVFFKGFGSGRTQTWRDEKEREAIDAGWGGGTHSDTAGFLVR